MDVNADLQRAAELARQGREDEARDILKAILRRDRDNLQAWLIMARLANNRTDLVFSLRQVLRLQPGHEWAAARLAQLEGAQPSSPPAAPPAAPPPAPTPPPPAPAVKPAESAPLFPEDAPAAETLLGSWLGESAPAEAPAAPARPAFEPAPPAEPSPGAEPEAPEEELEVRLGAWLEDMPAPPPRPQPAAPAPRPAPRPAPGGAAPRPAPRPAGLPPRPAPRPAPAEEEPRTPASLIWLGVLVAVAGLAVIAVIGLLTAPRTSPGGVVIEEPWLEGGAAPVGTLRLGAAGQRILEREGEVHYWALEAQAGQLLVIYVDAEDSVNPNLALFDAGGTQLAYDDDSGLGSDARLVFQVQQSGTYYLRVMSAAPGSYLISVNPG